MPAEPSTAHESRRKGTEASIRFSCPLPPRGLRVRSRTQHTGYRAKLVREYQEEVWCAGHEAMSAMGATFWWRPERGWTAGKAWERARLQLVWKHAGVGPDADNALAACKALIDVLHTRSKRPLGIVVDDSSAHLIIERVQTEKVAHKADECVVVTITRLEDDDG